jgi:hypothetical protein
MWRKPVGDGANRVITVIEVIVSVVLGFSFNDLRAQLSSSITIFTVSYHKGLVLAVKASEYRNIIFKTLINITKQVNVYFLYWSGVKLPSAMGAHEQLT